MRKLYRDLKPYRVSIVIVFLLIFLQVIFELYLPSLMADIVDIGIANADTPYILRVGALMLLMAGLATIFAIVSSFLSARTASGFGRDLRKKLFTKVTGFSLEEFDKFGTPSLITRSTNDINQMQQVVTMSLRMMLRAPFMAIGGIIMAVSKDKKLSIIIVFIMPIIALAMFIIGKKGMPLFKIMQERIDNLNQVLREKLSGIRVIRAFNRVEYEKKRFDAASRELSDNAIRVSRIMAAAMPIMMLLLNFTTIAIIWFGGARIDSGNMQVGDLMAFIQYVMQIMFSLIMFSMIFIMLPRASASAARINEVLDSTTAIKDPKEPKNVKTNAGSVEFKDVTFSYPGAEEPVLSNISFKTEPGDVTAIIGGTGSGKSTIINLVPRFYDIDSGSILLGGVDIRQMRQSDLRSKIGFVSQRAVLFSGTIRDNLQVGKEDATDDEIMHALKIAQASDFVLRMEDGLDSIVAQGGTNLSGGQKQRLSIARALIRRPDLYIFDDSFSALDFKTDARLRLALKEEIEDSSILIIAQRISTVMDADRIIVLNRGRVVGMGRHRQLLETCDVYREIASSQLSEEELA
ncbi:MAG: ABC transporter ATP-binding protein [Clostridiales bacterium]|nr:ABC transporter ATP-binding protein [Clostridiales bacterium]